MLFNSFAFAVFFSIIFIIYWRLSHRYQNIFLLIASYIFYGYWDWRFLSLIVISTFVDYITGLMIYKVRSERSENMQKKAKKWLLLSIFTNLGILGFFKYFNFFIDSFSELISALGLNISNLYLDIILPVGISFYTFQTLSYTIDIYRGELKPTRKLLEFGLYVAFFTQLVAGPIERARDLLPRILNKRRFNVDQFSEGLHLILLGLFKKVYVADNLAPVVDQLFQLNGITGFEVVVAAYTFAFQIYCDFSGYSDIARGCAKCIGFELMINFNHPYIAINPSDFWKRWHISLSTWLRDYLYIPLGGNKDSAIKTYRNLLLTMLLGGLWHGASLVFVTWGAYQSILLIGHRLVSELIERTIKIKSNIFNRSIKIIKILIMFQLVCLGWIIFRAQSISQIREMIWSLFNWQGQVDFSLTIPLIKFAGPLIVFESIQSVFTNDNWERMRLIPSQVRVIFYAILFYLIAFYGASAESFIYFQF